MKIKKTKLVMAVILGFSTGLFAQDSVTSTNQPQTDLMSQQFVQDAMAGGMKEIRLGEIALEKTQDPAVKKFAERMIRDHGRADKRLLRIADDEGLSSLPTNMFSADDPNWSYPLISNPNALKGDQMLTMTNLPYLADYQAIQSLQSLSGTEFDQSYAAEMVSDHTNAIEAFNDTAQNLSDKQLKKFAKKMLPTLKEHYDMAVELTAKVGETMNANSANTNAPAP